MSKVPGFFVLIALLLVALVTPSAAQEPRVQVPDETLDNIVGAKNEAQTYIVRLTGNPVITYEGDISGLPATKPVRGKKVNPNSANVRRYVAHLDTRHNEVLDRVGARANKLYHYRFSFNGFAAVLTPRQAAEIAAMPEVISIEPDEARQLMTDNTPSFLGLDASGGLWEQLGGQENAGEDIIVGIIDTGIWPEHPSFSDQVDHADRSGESGKDTLAYGPPPADWYGTCDSGEQFSQDDCNNKLIGARFFRLGANAATVITDDYLSPRDKDGHGTHTASTAAGNANVQATIFGVDRGVVSGMAPRARIAAYKVCWNDAGCYLSDIVKSIDAAVADGVDVINYSIGGGPSLLGGDDVAYLFAEAAGVFVATSAGNSGPGPETVGGPASVPWVTAVGASTHNRTFQGTAKLGNGARYSGASITGGTQVLPLVDSADAGSELCYPGELDSSVVAGKIVLCKRGVIARVDKSRAVAMAGGAGLILYNASDSQSQVTDNHYIPAVHINNTDGLAVKAYIDTAGSSATAQIVGGEKVSISAPSMAAFSSRGPNVPAPDIIKPDITAPGVNVLAGATPNPFSGAPGQLFQAISGTSMSSPHIAGLAALLRQAHPDWTPAMVKSALMTTARQDVKKEDSATPADPLDMGAGHVTPNRMTDPGLVYHTGFVDYLQFLCGQGALRADGRTCSAVGSIDPSDLNLASIGIAQLAGVQTIRRTVQNVGLAGIYNVSVEAPAGIDVEVNPSSLTLDSGESATYEVTFRTMSSAALNEWAFGALSWSDGSHSVRSPIAVKLVALAAPAELSGTGTEGSLSYEITFGYSGDFAAKPRGFVPASLQSNSVADDPTNDFNAALGTCDFSAFPFSCTGITWHSVSAPAGTGYLRVSLFDDYTDGSDDLDLFVFDSGFNFVGGSASGTSAEEVNVASPSDTTYYVAVHAWQSDGADANYSLFNWAIGDADAGNMGVEAPASATSGESEPVTIDWSNLEAGTKYLGSVTYHDTTAPAGYDDGLIDHTIIRIDTD